MTEEIEVQKDEVLVADDGTIVESPPKEEPPKAFGPGPTLMSLVAQRTRPGQSFIFRPTP